MTQTTAIARNTIIQTAGKAVSVILGWGTVIAMTNYLGAGGFGSYTIMTAYLQFFGVAVDLGLVLVSAQLLAESTTNQEKVFANLFTFRLVTSAVVLVIAPFVVWLLPYSLLVKQGVVILTFSFFFVALLQIFTGLFQKYLSMGRAMAGELLGRTLLLVVVLIAVWQAFGLLFIVAGIVVASFMNLGLVVMLSRKFVRLRLAYDKKIWQEIWWRSWPIALGIILNLVYLKADIIILSFVRPEAEVGVYGAMFRMLEVLITFPVMFAGLILPILSAEWLRNKRESFQRILQNALDVVLYMAVPLVVGVVFTAPRLAALFGQDFINDGAKVLQLLVLATGVIFVGSLLGHVVVAIHKQKTMLWGYALTAVLSLGGYLIIIPRYGAVGAAVMTIVAESFIAILIYGYLKYAMKLDFSFRKLGLAITASLPMALWVWLASLLPLVVVIVIAVILYFGVLYILGGIPRKFLYDIFGLTASNVN